MNDKEKKRQSLRIRDTIISKLNRLKGSRSMEHEMSAVYYSLASNVPEPILLKALGATDDRVYRSDRPMMHGASIDRYFLAIVKRICRERRITTGIMKWDNKERWKEYQRTKKNNPSTHGS